MNALRLTTCLMLTVALTACSNHWRESGSGLTSVDMQAALSELDQAQSQSQGGNLAEALALKDDENVSMYYADSSGAMGGVANVLGFYSYTILGLDADVGYQSISAARVFFFDAPQGDGTRKTALIIGIKTTSDQFTYTAFTGSSSIDNGDYEASLNDGSANLALILKSFDASSSGLDSVIQLKVFDAEGNRLGKIATLVGFKN